jgi:hypothetical protein
MDTLILLFLVALLLFTLIPVTDASIHPDYEDEQ